MAGDASFDVVSDFDRQELVNALDQVRREVASRYDFKGATAQIELNKHVKELERRMHEAGDKLAELAAASEERWDSVRKSAETTWDALKAGFNAAAAKFKE